MSEIDNLSVIRTDLLPLKCCQATQAGILIPPDITFEQWKQDLLLACSVRDVADTVLPLVIGQLLNQGESRFSARDARGRFINQHLHERYEIVARHIGVKFGTISNWRSVERSVPHARRLRFIPPLLYSHIVKVAAMDDAKQEYWLGRALREKMSCLDLQEAIEKERRARLPPQLELDFIPNLTHIRLDLQRCLNRIFARTPEGWRPEERTRLKRDLTTVRDEINRRIAMLEEPAGPPRAATGSLPHRRLRPGPAFPADARPLLPACIRS